MNWTYGTIYKRNSEMMLKALKNEKVPPNSLIIDLTNGLGQFTANPAVRQKYKLFAVDKYKNRTLQPEVFRECIPMNALSSLSSLQKERLLLSSTIHHTDLYLVSTFSQTVTGKRVKGG